MAFLSDLSGRTLEARQGRLRRQALTRERTATQQQLLGWVVPQARGIVGVFVPAGDAVDALSQHVMQGVLNLAVLPPLDERARQRPCQSEPLIRGAREQRSSIAARVRLIEAGQKRLRSKPSNRTASSVLASSTRRPPKCR